jgi:ABC-2 type transport system permease protein
MKNPGATFITECMKLHRSRMVWISCLLFAFIPFMICMMLYIQQHPEISDKLGIIGTKANMVQFGKIDWASYFGLLTQGVAAIGLIGFGFVTSWVFGREFSDRTAKDILALPVSRSSIVVGKLLLVVVWCILLTTTYFVSGLVFGKLWGIPGWSASQFATISGAFFGTSLLTILLCPPVAFIASWGHGYLLPLSFIILTLLMANFTGLLGLGPVFPWAIPGLFGTASGVEGVSLIPASYVILALTSLAGIAGTLIWWVRADFK